MSAIHPHKTAHNDSRSHDLLLAGVLSYMAAMLLIGSHEPQLPHWLQFGGYVLAGGSLGFAYRMVFPYKRAE